MKLKLTELINVSQESWSEHSISTENGFISVIVKRMAAEVVAYLNVCPHQGRRLEYAKNQFLETPDGLLVCPAHGATFRTHDGFCTGGPCMGQSLKKLAAVIEDKYVFIEVE
ncbi:Rieske (2Fe-2S) protein [Marinicella sp. W31]|uniref:Rieske (2Fe-2S) protein n=1 Tax=Marinicella sp. W31 TaxID=3023713 RepID=UPI003757E614